VKQCENWLQEHYREIDAIRQIVELSEVPERSLKRRFKAATGLTLIEQLQNLRIEEAKRLLEQGEMPIDEISDAVGYMDISFFRRLFKRLTGLPPGQYRRMFQPIEISATR
jgi:transcriptional regulator GlxA family with amidase domain